MPYLGQGYFCYKFEKSGMFWVKLNIFRYGIVFAEFRKLVPEEWIWTNGIGFGICIFYHPPLK
ncbi:hypothetical protein CH359_03625 [Leptospira meyeri]|nr:hypothetical protein CH359_03625 [Leptospira meyeri]PJZ97551.1 hypothetical protein CH358_00665 [Leptospira meyeri]PKA12355.1 hypothetical protein CH372_09695 [Leptospira meyeri]